MAFSSTKLKSRVNGWQVGSSTLGFPVNIAQQSSSEGDNNSVSIGGKMVYYYMAI